jgi:hypothetical protein
MTMTKDWLNGKVGNSNTHVCPSYQMPQQGTQLLQPYHDKQLKRTPAQYAIKQNATFRIANEWIFNVAQLSIFQLICTAWATQTEMV